MCKRTTPDPLLRRFLDRYGLHLLAIPRAGAAVGDVYIFDGRRTSPAGHVRHLLEPPLELSPKGNEPMADVAGRMSREIGLEAALGVLEAFLVAMGASGIVDSVKAGYTRQDVQTLCFAFEDPVRDHVDVLEVAAALDERRFRPGQALDPEHHRFYITTTVARSRSISVQGRAESQRSVDVGAGVVKVADLDARIKVKRLDDGTVTYDGDRWLTFGVELYELSYDGHAQALRLAMPHDPVAVRGTAGARPPRAVIGDPAGDVLLAVD